MYNITVLYDNNNVSVTQDGSWFVVKQYNGSELAYKCRFDTKNAALKEARALANKNV